MMRHDNAMQHVPERFAGKRAIVTEGIRHREGDRGSAWRRKGPGSSPPT